MKLFDTSVWIEFFKGSPSGEQVKLILQKEQVYTSTITLAEISRWAHDNSGDIHQIVRHIKKNSVLIPLEEPILIECGKQYTSLRKIKPKMGMIDMLIYFSALFHGLDVLTTDSDFKGLPSVEMLQ
ncbi:MAG: PIN domain-containing protein [Candidatus Woesearchaeota archaeon]|nr:PIN domain-containing protein [Candidatus Woesearchaeota archaeon]